MIGYIINDAGGVILAAIIGVVGVILGVAISAVVDAWRERRREGTARGCT